MFHDDKFTQYALPQKAALDQVKLHKYNKQSFPYSREG